ncbi:2-keto-4-pentenoate hydratase/2-oxohepta-3-ene-1,7-dioic acid hydratase in catechol pathway [Azorhizobium sp. AG788]|nr:2-keto-4-pentenoate hydratase/2-oxohepta-3-ene-1,7-dioic acid hydratase in catechol pathway [Azorhizobium sp. AG788]
MDTGRRSFMVSVAAAAAAAAPLMVGPTHEAVAQTNDPGGALKLLSFRLRDGAPPRVGVALADGTVVDLTAEAARSGKALSFKPDDMVSLIAAGDKGLAEVRELVAQVAPGRVKLTEIIYLPPIPNPQRNIYAVGWNYLEHFAEGQAVRMTDTKYPEHPVFFTKGTHSINGPFDPIPFDPKVSTQIDWEGELAIVIGRRGRNIPEAEALDYVFGYSVINDTTARDVQNARHGGQWFKGKSLDGHGPMGPWIVTKGAFDQDKLHLVTRVNGVVKQDASTGQMYFKVPRIIAELSLGLTLEPGDIIASGTPPGVGFARKPQEFLKPGDVMETEIVGIGTLRNEIKAVG